ncbi:uncharacterized protein CC84DRAFT_1089552 [Paraphaeosphaeria sporulosa]|uniref:DUF6594 domain-containing protein n=1 Tax=Paraphaeosphaeria sporulosa TaxID=1460663 RepID=A0A177CJY1_9PLEO|nr:uncharacterized protein CC84DRAFT_1089552 [Paraphaeosphaeria sporulosa]OAG07178.1 hypothetical protein CC84DRAFT_1089552 [Paraphaeosphaeria sporulosa]
MTPVATTSRNSNNASHEKPKGYPMLAAQIEQRPEMAIFRRFGALNAENLLYLQAELVLLEDELRKQQAEDHSSSIEYKAKYALNWFHLRNSRSNGDSKQLDLVHTIRETLWQYSEYCNLRTTAGLLLIYRIDEALIQQSRVLSYPEPDRYDLEYMQRFLHSKAHMDLCLLGPDAAIWGSLSKPDSHSPDLASLCPRKKEDPFSNWVVDNAITKLVRCGCSCFLRSSRADMRGIIGYEDIKVMQITYWMTSVIASLLPIGSIVILYKVQSTAARLGIIAAFNVLVSLCLSAFTNAKRAEVFAITAA